ncbi:MAG: VWA domain-containing protein [Pseudomonadota bacterium]
MDLISHFIFLRPLWLICIPIAWAIVFWLAKSHNNQGNWSQIIDPVLLPTLSLDEGNKKRSSPWSWLALVWTLGLLALAGPSWQQAPALAYRGQNAWVLVYDLSPSMLSTDINPNRVTRARYALDDLLNAAKDARVGLVAFSDEAFTVTPITDDVATIRALLPPLTPEIMPSAGDNLTPALQQAELLINKVGRNKPQIVVVTDGFDDPAAALAIAKKLKSNNITVNVVGVGNQSSSNLRHQSVSNGSKANTQNSSFINIDQLEQLASSGGGRYVNIAQLPSLIDALQASNNQISQMTENKSFQVTRRLDGGIWLLPLLLIIAALLARRGWL